MTRPPPRSPLFPSTTLFRPLTRRSGIMYHRLGHQLHQRHAGAELVTRSEEHTSELQSPDHLVCRLLLEKKKNVLRITCLSPPEPVPSPLKTPISQNPADSSP